MMDWVCEPNIHIPRVSVSLETLKYLRFLADKGT